MGDFSLKTLFSMLMAAAIALGVSPVAVAVGEVPAPDTLVGEMPTQFYRVAERKIPVPVGSPYLTEIGPSTVLSLDWDFELAATNIAFGTSTALGTLDLPAESRVLDIYWDKFLPKSATRTTAMIAYGEFGPNRCRRSVMREALIDMSGSGQNSLGRVWFTSPCYPALDGVPLAQAGGRITRAIKAITGMENPKQFFLTVGDFSLSRTQMNKLGATKRKYLTTALLITAPGESQVWARGLRNAQGITTAFIDNKHALVATLHGPRGGDEINIVERGGDYGWPQYSYGTAYGANQPQNLAVNQGTASTRYPPLFAWVPAIGPTSVLQVKGPAFKTWWSNGNRTSDLIVNGMGSNWIYRLRIDGGAVRYVEPMFTGVRLRTLIQMPNGELVGGIDKSSSELIVFTPTAVWQQAGEFVAP